MLGAQSYFLPSGVTAQGQFYQALVYGPASFKAFALLFNLPTLKAQVQNPKYFAPPTLSITKQMLTVCVQIQFAHFNPQYKDIITK